MAQATAVVDVSYDERYWYPADGGIVWIVGYQLVDRTTGSYLGREAPELAERGLRVAGVAGAARHHADALASEAAAPGSPLRLRRDPANPHDPNAVAVETADGGDQVGWVPRDIAAELAPEIDAGRPWSAVVLREQRKSPRDPRHGLTMLLAASAAIELRARCDGGLDEQRVEHDRLGQYACVAPAASPWVIASEPLLIASPRVDGGVERLTRTSLRQADVAGVHESVRPLGAADTRAVYRWRAKGLRKWLIGRTVGGVGIRSVGPAKTYPRLRRAPGRGREEIGRANQCRQSRQRVYHDNCYLHVGGRVCRSPGAHRRDPRFKRRICARRGRQGDRQSLSAQRPSAWFIPKYQNTPMDISATQRHQLSRRARLAMRALWTLGLAGLTLFVAHEGLGLWAAHDSAFQVLYVCTFLVPAAICILRAIVVPSERWPWGLFGIGMATSAAGYAHYFLVLQDVESPSPSLSDALWLVSSAASFLAVLLLLRSRITNAPRNVAIDALIAALTLAAIAAALLVDPILESTGGSVVAVSTNLAYPLFDVLILGLIAPVFVFSGWRPSRSWWLIAMAFACLLVFDTLYLYKAAGGTYVAGTLLEAVFPAIMLLIAYAAWWPPERRTAVQLEGWPVVLIPSLFVVVAVALTTYDSFYPVNDLAAILATAVLVLGVVRLATTFAEVRSLERSSELERRLQQSQRLESVGQLAGGIAHDFNNLLAVILNYASFVREELSECDPVRRDVDEIHRAAERAAALTRQLLTFSRRDVIEPELLDLNAVVSDLEKLLRRTLGEDVELRTSLAPGLPSVEADRSQFEQVLLNLAINARDAMPEGGTLSIETAGVDESVSGAGGGVGLRVTDTGCGMSQELATRAFEPFFSTKSKDKGSGLGLSTVYGIVAGSGGQIDLRSEPGRGTEVDVTLPAAQWRAAPAPTRRTPRPPPRGRETTILLVEDELAVREVTRRILARHGHEVLAAGSPSDALRVLANHEWPLGLLLTDVVMPDMSGKELAERITKIQPNLPVLYMSGYTEEIVSRHGALEPGAPLLRKPFDAESLLASVHQVLVAK